MATGHEEQIVSPVQQHLRHVLVENGFARDVVGSVCVGMMGSRVYLGGAKEGSTDLDLYTSGCTREMVQRFTDLLNSLACRLLRAGVVAKKN